MDQYLQAVTWTIVACVSVPLALVACVYAWEAFLDAWGWMRETEYHRTKQRVAADLRYYSCWLSESSDAMEALKAFGAELEQPTRLDMSNVRESWRKATGRSSKEPAND